MLSSKLPGLRLLARGKVRDLYEVGKTLLLVATDRVSTFDVVLPDPIPEKGRVLTAISSFWFRTSRDVWPNHFLTDDVDAFPPELQPFKETLRGRSTLGLRAEKLAFECVARGYLAGSAWQEYRSSGTVAGKAMPAGLRVHDRLPEPIFTPATKAEVGHDQNLTMEELERRIGRERARELERATLALYGFMSDYAEQRGIIVADTKFEFGLYNGRLIVIDEMGTPDSSRFWPAEAWRPGEPVPSFDKQPLRDYLEGTGWNKEPPAPRLPPAVIRDTTERYLTILRRLAEDDPDRADA